MAVTPEQFARLLAATRGGDRQAAAELLAMCRAHLRPVAAGLLPASLQAKADESDLTQDSLLGALRHLEDFRGHTEAELRAWLDTILRREAADFRRRYLDTAKRRPGAEVPLHGSGPRATPEPEDRGPSPLGEVVNKENAERLWAGVEGLPANYRAIVELHIRENLTFDDIARRLGINARTACHHFGLAMHLLRERLKNLQ